MSPTAFLFLYLAVGPLAWAMLIAGTLLGRSRMARLTTWKVKPFESPPSVAILIPAKDEEAGIVRCINSVLAQDYPNFKVIAIDDRSTDQTPALIDHIARRDARLTLMRIPNGALPAGWLGKCHALHVGTRGVADEWLFLVDSDVTLEPSALSSMLSIATTRGYDAVTILTRLECQGLVERLMLPVLAGTWSVMHAISLTNEDSRKDVAAANGQVFLIRRSAYETVGGHESVKDRITEDVELMRRLKARDFKVRFFSGAHLAATRMHSTLRQMFNGWARIFSGTSDRRPWRILGAMWFLTVFLLSVYPALAYGAHQSIAAHEPAWLAASIAHWILMTLDLALIYRWSGNPMRYALLAPVSGAIELAILAFALRKCQTGRIIWRETTFDANAIPALPRMREKN